MAMKPIRVSQLNTYIKRLLQSDPLLGNVSVIGEISNLKHHGNGHVYFTLKEEGSKINCFLPQDLLKDIRFELGEGMEIIAEGYIYLYERGGTYSLNIRDIRVEGMGNLSIAFEKLKEKLSKEGLFDDRHKKPIPSFPLNIAVVTSGTGAAVSDIITIIKRKNDVVNVTVFPVLVQGPGAATEIAAAIDLVNHQFPYFDTIIVGRGGGSKEELWAFNEEIVARSIFHSSIPIISAVGHEIDFSISDFIADKRAETPTAAAQMVAPDTAELRQYIHQCRTSLRQGMEHRFQLMEMRLQAGSPIQMGRLLTHRLEKEMLFCHNKRNELHLFFQQIMTLRENQLINYKNQLIAMNPYSILQRGYAAILDHDGILRSSIENFKEGDGLTACLRDGRIQCRVLESTGDHFEKQ